MTGKESDAATRNRIRIADLAGLVGQPLGRSDWHAVTQTAVDGFAEATGDKAWIHVDVDRAKASPFGGTIAHGFFTLALIPALTAEAFEIPDAAILVNYGVNRARFPAPLRVGRRVRLETTLNGLEAIPNGARLALGFTMAIDDELKPAAVGETVLMVLAEDPAHG